MEPGQHPLEQGLVGTVARVGRPVDHDQVLVGHVTDQDADHAEGKMELCRDLGDGQKVVAEDGDARCSTVSFGVCSTEVVETSDSISRGASWVGRVRPAVMA
jgi:hypothetical protein